jgi:DNA-binding NarL/FixJ family response regulator
MDPFRILLADDHPIFRLGMRSVVESHESWEVCGEAGDGREAVEKCMQLEPDLIIMDICMPGLNGVEGIRHILKDNPAQKILIFTNVDSEKLVRDCLQAGVRGWVLKSGKIDNLTMEVEGLQQHRFISEACTPAMLVSGRWSGTSDPTAAKAPRLSPRQREVLQLLVEGRRSKSVAAMLDISVKTAETHRTNLMSKLNLHSLAKLVIYAVRNGIIDVQVPPVATLSEWEDLLGNVTVPEGRLPNRIEQATRKPS